MDFSPSEEPLLARLVFKHLDFWDYRTWHCGKRSLFGVLPSPVGIEGSDDEALDQGHDEELSRWEQEQIRKGISIPQVGVCTRVLTLTH